MNQSPRIALPAFRLPSRRFLRGLALPVLLLMIWEAIARSGHADAHVFVPVERILQTGWEMLSSGELPHHLGISLGRLAGGLLLGTTLGLLLGGLLGLSPTADRLLGPLFHAYRQVAHFAWMPLISMAFGLGYVSLTVFISLSALSPVVLNTYQGIRSVPLAQVEVARIYRFTRLQLLRRVVLPAALPSIFTGLELAALYSWLGTVGAEYLLDTSGRSGVGGLMEVAVEHFRTDIAFIGIAVTGLVGYAINAALRALKERLLAWRKSFQGVSA
jgi:sulfonate transport system permease protein